MEVRSHIRERTWIRAAEAPDFSPETDFWDALVNICLTDGGGVSVGNGVGVMTVVAVAVDMEDCEDWNDVDAVTTELTSLPLSFQLQI